MTDRDILIFCGGVVCGVLLFCVVAVLGIVGVM